MQFSRFNVLRTIAKCAVFGIVFAGSVVTQPSLSEHTPAVAETPTEQHTSTKDGAELYAPQQWQIGQPLKFHGKNWLNNDKTGPSVIAVLLRTPDITTKRDVKNPLDGTVSGDKRLHAIIKANNDGSWDAEIPFPTPDNSSLQAPWQQGQKVDLRLLSGSLGDNDVVRNPKLTITVSDPKQTPPSQPSTPASQPSNPASQTSQAPTQNAANKPEITTHPASQTIESGESVTFSASATNTQRVQWQYSKDGGQTWEDVRFATGSSLTVPHISLQNNGWLYRAKFTGNDQQATVFSNPAKLSVTPRANIRVHCDTAYAPTEFVGKRFCFKGPERVLPNEAVTIEGISDDSYWLATDGATGSMAVFFQDAKFSGDPDTVYTRIQQKHPQSGAVLSDTRINAVVQASPDSTWKVSIPAPSIENLSPVQNLSRSFTPEEFNKRFAVGTQHSIRMLTGTMLSNPQDVSRGSQLEYTIVNDINAELPVQKPLVDHHTLEYNGATAWIPKNVKSSGSIKISGTGFSTSDKKSGSQVIIRLKNENGEYYKTGDSDIWATMLANERGELVGEVPLPATAGKGAFVSVELETLGDNGDVARKLESKTLIIDNVPFAQVNPNATCKNEESDYKLITAPEQAVKAARIGGKIHLVGNGFCNKVGGGSLLAVKINGGSFQHVGNDIAQKYDANLGKIVGDDPTALAHDNKTVWFTIEADKNGHFDFEMPLPDANNTTPKFKEGSYTLQFLTRTLAADPYYNGTRPDPSRTFKSDKFTVVAEGASIENVLPGKPGEIPPPPHVDNDLIEKNMFGMTADIAGDNLNLKLRAPGQDPWVYVTLFEGQSPRTIWGSEWFKLNQDGTLTLPLTNKKLPRGRHKLAVQNSDGQVIGWTWLTVNGTDSETPQALSIPGPIRHEEVEPTPEPAVQTSTPEPAFPVSNPVKALQKAFTSTPLGSANIALTKYDDLNDDNRGDFTSVKQDDGKIVIKTEMNPGEWVYMYLYSKTGDTVPVGWFQVDADRKLFADTNGLPNGEYRLAFSNRNNQLLGWIRFSRSSNSQPLAPGVQHQQSAQQVQAPTSTANHQAATQQKTDFSWIYYAVAALIIIIAACFAAVIIVKKPGDKNA